MRSKAYETVSHNVYCVSLRVLDLVESVLNVHLED